MTPNRFMNREGPLAKIKGTPNQTTLLNIYGECGIGKSRLIIEAIQKLRQTSPSPLIVHIDLEVLSSAEDLQQALLTELVNQLDNFRPVSTDNTQVVHQIINALRQVIPNRPVYLFFDTTEVLQNTEFWRWLEINLVGPLTLEEKIHQIFAGRLPVNWRRVEIRRIAQYLALEPLDPAKAARELIEAVLASQNPDWADDDAAYHDATEKILSFSFGHPALSEALAVYLARHWQPGATNNTDLAVCEKIVTRFINENFFNAIPSPWDEIIWLLSVLDWFDVTVIQRYLKALSFSETAGRPDYFYIQGLSQLRHQHTIIWQEARGDRLHGVVGNIVRRCLATSNPNRYRKACLAAAETMDSLAAEFPDNEPEHQEYRNEAAQYRHRANKEI